MRNRKCIQEVPARLGVCTATFLAILRSGHAIANRADRGCCARRRCLTSRSSSTVRPRGGPRALPFCTPPEATSDAAAHSIFKISQTLLLYYDTGASHSCALSALRAAAAAPSAVSFADLNVLTTSCAPFALQAGCGRRRTRARWSCCSCSSPTSAVRYLLLLLLLPACLPACLPARPRLQSQLGWDHAPLPHLPLQCAPRDCCSQTFGIPAPWRCAPSAIGAMHAAGARMHGLRTGRGLRRVHPAEASIDT